MGFISIFIRAVGALAKSRGILLVVLLVYTLAVFYGRSGVPEGYLDTGSIPTTQSHSWKQSETLAVLEAVLAADHVDEATAPVTADDEPETPIARFAAGPLDGDSYEYYAPIIDSLGELGPPAKSCLPKGAEGGRSGTRKFDTVLLLAQGRSGSTSVLRLLNAIPCYNLRGENRMALSNVILENKFSAEAFEKTAKALSADPALFWKGTRYKEPNLPHKPSHFNRWDPTRLQPVLDALAKQPKDAKARTELNRLFVNNFLEHVPGSVTSGFKEIRLFYPLDHDFTASLEFMDQWIRMYPKTAVVLLSRGSNSLLRSGWWRKANETTARGIVERQSKWFDDFAAIVAGGDRYGPRGSVVAGPNVTVAAARVWYEDATACNLTKGSSLYNMFEVLGEKPDPAACLASMGNNVEDGGLAMSWYDFGFKQGDQDWEYGSRLLSRGTNVTTFSDFELLSMNNVKVINSTIGKEREFRHPKQPVGLPFLRKTLNGPFFFRNGTQVVPCRRWTHTIDDSPKVSVRVKAKVPPPGCHFTVHLPRGAEPGWKRTVTKAEMWKVDVKLSKGTVIEMCVSRKREDSCPQLAGLEVDVVVSRSGLKDGDKN